MKVYPFKIPKAQNIGVIYQEDEGDFFYNKLHQHEEIQISIIIEGEGTLIVGDTISDYKNGDILVIGSSLPHVLKSDINKNAHSKMLSLFFTKQSFGDDFFELNDFEELYSFFNKSQLGFKLTSNLKDLHELFTTIEKANNLERFITFFKILNIINNSSFDKLSNFIYPKKISDNEGKRMQNIMDYTINNFENTIDLDTVAEIANMTPNAFCRYFKQRTNKTYFKFLNELRIEHACKLLINNKELGISEIAYQSGFKNLSNFNRKFKEIKNISPSKYRKRDNF